MSDRAPLAVITREADAGDSLARALAAHGLRAWHVPTIVTTPPPRPADVDDAIETLRECDWVVFTSPRAVAAACSRTKWAQIWPGVAARVRLAAVGPGTADALGTIGLSAAIVSQEPGSDGLLAALAAAQGLAGRRILWPRGDGARDAWAHAALRAGALVTAPVAYCTVGVPVEGLDALVTAVRARGIAAITFLSPSSATSLARAFPEASLRELHAHVAVAAIGPTTALALEALDAPPNVVAATPTVDALADGLARHLAIAPGGRS
jgi:uroporphyrinogen-III synthase